MGVVDAAVYVVFCVVLCSQCIEFRCDDGGTNKNEHPRGVTLTNLVGVVSVEASNCGGGEGGWEVAVVEVVGAEEAWFCCH